MSFPETCPECGADLTKNHGVTEVQEMYTNNHVEDGELVDEQKETCGECVRAFCTVCGHSFYNEKDVDAAAFNLLLIAFADLTGIDYPYVRADFYAQAKRQVESDADAT